MGRQKEKEAEIIFRLNKKLFFPLVLLLTMPLAMVIRGLLYYGLSDRNLFSLTLMVLIIFLFLPWLTRKVAVSPKGVISNTLLSRNNLAWSDIKKVSGFSSGGRAVIVIEGKRQRLVFTNILGNFKYLASYIIEHVSEVFIEDNVAPLLMIQGRSGKDALMLWIAVGLMTLLLTLNIIL